MLRPYIDTELAKKKHSDEILKRGLEELAKAGVTPDGGATAQVRVLTSQFGIRRERDLAVIYSLGKLPIPRPSMLSTRSTATLATRSTRRKSSARCSNYHNAVLMWRERGCGIKRRRRRCSLTSRTPKPTCQPSMGEAAD